MVQLSPPAPSPSALTLDEMVRELDRLPAAPRVLPRLKQLLSDGNTAMSDVVEMVRLDPGIAARVLQFGNSAYFSHGLRCYTVEEAVNRVGYDQIYELVATAVASQVLVRPLATYGMEIDELWENSIACALASEELASSLGADRNIAYTIGLLHSIGMVAIDDWATRRRPGLRLASKGLPLETCESERAALGFHHAEAGATLLRLWAFPQVMSEPVRWQYLPNGTAAHFQLAAVLHAAKWLRTMVVNPKAAPARPQAALLGSLKLTNRQLDKLVGEVAAKFRAINVQLQTLQERTVSVRFPAGERHIAQGNGPLRR
ncbi:MAG TPA: HDOD domain-containing protein [Lacunisphaera sp.]|nr:HDOD domain-containing protein [Lacunisphaera sp.]